jgi:hypothetical protein
MFDIYLLLPYNEMPLEILHVAELYEPVCFARTDAGLLMTALPEKAPKRALLVKDRTELMFGTGGMVL